MQAVRAHYFPLPGQEVLGVRVPGEEDFAPQLVGEVDPEEEHRLRPDDAHEEGAEAIQERLPRGHDGPGAQEERRRVKDVLLLSCWRGVTVRGNVDPCRSTRPEGP